MTLLQLYLEKTKYSPKKYYAGLSPSDKKKRLAWFKKKKKKFEKNDYIKQTLCQCMNLFYKQLQKYFILKKYCLSPVGKKRDQCGHTILFFFHICSVYLIIINIKKG
jgi:predicted solute-binding protein